MLAQIPHFIALILCKADQMPRSRRSVLTLGAQTAKTRHPVPDSAFVTDSGNWNHNGLIVLTAVAAGGKRWEYAVHVKHALALAIPWRQASGLFTTSVYASRSIGGNALPRRFARRRIPSQAVLLKEHFAGASACKIDDKVDTISSLGHAPVFRSLNAPCNGEMISHDLSCVEPASLRRFRNRKGIIAEVDKRLEDGAEVGAFRAGEESGYVFEDGVFGILSMGRTPHFTNDPNCLEE